MGYPRTSALVAVAAASLVCTSALAKDNFKADLDGYQETPAVSSTGTGEFRAHVNKEKTKIEFEFIYAGLEGGNSLFAHIHFGQPGVAGGVAAFLCGGSTKPTPCPNVEGTVTGTIDSGRRYRPERPRHRTGIVRRTPAGHGRKGDLRQHPYDPLARRRDSGTGQVSAILSGGTRAP